MYPLEAPGERRRKRGGTPTEPGSEETRRMSFRLASAGAVVRRAQGLFHSQWADFGGSDALDQQPEAPTATNVFELIYELLDAHADTSDLAAELSYDADWAAHL